MQQAEKVRHKRDWTVLRYHVSHSTYVSVLWNWFLELSGKLAAPFLLMSVLYAGLKLTDPSFVAAYLSTFDAFINVAQILALDMGGLGLLAVAKQAEEHGNEVGAKKARRVALGMFSLMMITLSLSSLSTAFHWHESEYAWFVGVLLIARAILSVLYGILIHELGTEKADHEVVNAADVREQLHGFTALLQRLEQANEQRQQVVQNQVNELVKHLPTVTLLASHLTQVEQSLHARIHENSTTMENNLQEQHKALVKVVHVQEEKHTEQVERARTEYQYMHTRLEEIATLLLTQIAAQDAHKNDTEQNTDLTQNEDEGDDESAQNEHNIGDGKRTNNVTLLRTQKRAEKALKAVRIIKRNPAIAATELAKRAGISPSYARQLLAKQLA